MKYLLFALACSFIFWLTPAVATEQFSMTPDVRRSSLSFDFDNFRTNSKLLQKILNLASRNAGHTNSINVPELCSQNKAEQTTNFCRSYLSHNQDAQPVRQSIAITSSNNQLQYIENTQKRAENFKNHHYNADYNYQTQRYDPQLVSQCKRLIFHASCNMTIILNDIALSESQISVFQHWMNQYNQYIVQHWANAAETANIIKTLNATKLSTFEIMRANQMLSCIQNAYYIVDFDARKCLLNLISPENKQKIQASKVLTKNKTEINEKTIINLSSVLTLSDFIDATTTATTSPVGPLAQSHRAHHKVLTKMVEYPNATRLYICRKSPTQCPMNVTLYGLNFDQWQIDIFQQWMNEYLHLAAIDNSVESNEKENSNHHDYGVEYREKNKKQNNSIMADAVMVRAFSMLACFREFSNNSNTDQLLLDSSLLGLRNCLIEMLQQYRYLSDEE